jgi:hypothetical protein
MKTVTARTPAKTSGARGVAAAFGLDPRVALLTVIVDAMLFGGDALTFGALIPIGIVVAVILAFIVFKIQRMWCNTNHSRVTAKLNSGRLVTVRGSNLTVDSVITTLEDLLSRCRAARTKGLGLRTLLNMLSDEARQSS